MSNECKKIDDQSIKNETSFVEDLRAIIVAYFKPFITVCFVDPQNCTFCNK